MKTALPARTWQRLIALLSVLAVVLGGAPRELVSRAVGSVVGMAPASLPELRAALPHPPLVPQEPGESPATLPWAAPTVVRVAGVAVRARLGYRPDAFALGGARQLEGG